MANAALVKFIKEARRRGFDDYQIKEPLLTRGWPLVEVEKAFASLTPKYKFKNKVSVFLDSDILKLLEKRAKKNMFTLSEQIEDILRRSCLNTKKVHKEEEKLDDMFVKIFSRKSSGRPIKR